MPGTQAALLAGAHGSMDSGGSSRHSHRRLYIICYSSSSSSSSSSMAGCSGSRSPAAWRPSQQGLAASHTTAPGGLLPLPPPQQLQRALNLEMPPLGWRLKLAPGQQGQVCGAAAGATVAGVPRAVCALRSGTAVCVLHSCRTQGLCSQCLNDFSVSTL